MDFFVDFSLFFLKNTKVGRSLSYPQAIALRQDLTGFFGGVKWSNRHFKIN